MELRLLHYFVAVCTVGTVHGAAEKVHVAQPSLSRQIRRLERELGFDLFERTGHRLALTMAGRSFLPVAQDLLARAAGATAAARAIAKGGEADLTVAAASTTITDIIAPYVVHAGQEGAIGNVTESIPEHVYDVIAAGEADFAVGTQIPPAELSSTILGNAYLWAQVPPDHHLAGRDEIPIDELLDEPLVVMSRAHSVRRMFDAAAEQAGKPYTPLVETESPSLAQGLAAAGRGVCVLSDDPRYGLTAVPISTPTGQLLITLFGAWDPLHYAHARIATCLEELRAFNAQLYPQVAMMPGEHRLGAEQVVDASKSPGTH